MDGQPLFSFPNPFPSSLATAVIPSQSVTGFPLQTDTGAIHQYNFSIEREVRDIGLRASYIGSRGVGLNYNVGINKPQAGTTAGKSLRTFAAGEQVRPRNEEGSVAIVYGPASTTNPW